MRRLRELGYELRRPEADYLRDGIYELRVRYGHTNLRILYFFFENEVVVLAQAVTKEQEVPPKDIEVALARKQRFSGSPETHALIWEP
jgi:phage-related protein